MTTNSKDNLGLLALGIKAGIGFILNLIIWKKFNAEDFVTWSILYYLGIFTSLSDFGIGQYLVRENFRKLNISLIKNGFALISLIVIFLFFLVYLFTTFYFNEHQFFIIIITGIFLARMLYVPFSAIMVAKSDFYLKKIIEAASLLIGGILLLISFYNLNKLEDLIIAFNIGITLTSLATIIFIARKYDITNDFIAVEIQWIKLKEILIESFNFFKNNLSNAFVYSLLVPFISLFDIPHKDKFIAYFTFLFILIYQIIEVYFRHRQSKILSNELDNYKVIILTLFLMITTISGLSVLNIIPFVLNQTWVYIFLLILFAELFVLRRSIFLQLSEAGDIPLGRTIFIRLGWFILIYLSNVEDLTHFSLLILLQSVSIIIYLNKTKWI